MCGKKELSLLSQTLIHLNHRWAENHIYTLRALDSWSGDCGFEPRSGRLTGWAVVSKMWPTETEDAASPLYLCVVARKKKPDVSLWDSLVAKNLNTKGGNSWNHIILGKLLGCIPRADTVFFTAQDILRPGCRRKKKRAQHKYQMNRAVTDFLQAGYNITRQSIIAIFFLCLWWARLFPPVVRA